MSKEACTASPDHADIMETIDDAADDWQSKGYTSALAEVRDMAAVGRSLMEALPEGYCYMNSPAEIVSDLQNDLEEARALNPDAPLTREAELARAVVNILPIGDERAPGDRVIPIYVRMDELRALRELADLSTRGTK